MYLYHFSDQSFDILNPKYFGLNSYTKNDKKHALQRAFCYDTKTPKEYCFNSVEYRYTIKVSKKNIYNLDNDKLKLKTKFNYEIDKILEYTAKHFDGIVYTTSFKTYCLFNCIAVHKKQKRKQYNQW